jgi:hypothetical protein
MKVWRNGGSHLAITGAVFALVIWSTAQGQAPDQLQTVQGKVQSFTTAPRGEVDGLMLDDGTWVHWPPHLQGRFKDIAAVGDRVEATGRIETGPAGDEHFETQSLVNLSKNARANGNVPAIAGDRAQRLRDIENQLEQLLREVQRLRRER